MFYTPQDGHGLAHNPFSAIIAPRPIAWISTQDAQGNSNLAPYSFFNATAYVPPHLNRQCGRMKLYVVQILNAHLGAIGGGYSVSSSRLRVG